MSVFVLAFISSFLFYLYGQKDVHMNWRKKIALFPVFMAGSAGFAVNNSRAVVEGLLNRKSEFVRTPKFKTGNNGEDWTANKYVQKKKIGLSVYVELLLAVYCFVGVVASVYFMEIAALPFQLMYFSGFAIVSIMSLRHAWAGSGSKSK
jgi:hypothetical protein